ncbi:hypothetical protein GS399_05055 [Pedobacter sp. HMF7647]|uniref:Uncharacterized protein n=1 Tax=Hufsiella arboris TaxID=2695275 RepID=A0A7K1Y6X7_9SPHI|nr:hypothetical protein [Hufsiella arboris]MXV50332.1 hypothetical protein [Hufsiella arboris]
MFEIFVAILLALGSSVSAPKTSSDSKPTVLNVDTGGEGGHIPPTPPPPPPGN